MRDLLHEGPGRGAATTLLRRPEERDWPAIMAIEDAAYEPDRRDSEEYLRRGALHGLGLLACDAESGSILGFCFGGPIEVYLDTPGPADDPRQGKRDTFFAADCTVDASARGRGIGRLLKRAQAQWARARGYRFITGRNRIGKAGVMMAINRELGARHVRLLQREAGVDEYYEIDLAALPDDPRLQIALTALLRP